MSAADRIIAAARLDAPELVALYLATHDVQGQDAWAPSDPEYALKQALWHIGRAIHGKTFVRAVEDAIRTPSGDDWQAEQSQVANAA